MTDRTDKTAGRVLLPSHVVPTRYNLHLTPDFQGFTFAGQVTISFDVNTEKLAEHPNEIILHYKELCFISAEFTATGRSVAAEEIVMSNKSHTVKFIFPENLPDASFTCTIKYSGFLNDQMAGFYRSNYKNAAGESCIMASTQFEALDARRCFPCVDEPSAKAIFDVTLVIPAHMKALSNMPVAKQTFISAKQVEVSFWPSPVMSTYLLAFCVGEFDCVQSITPKGGVLVSVYTPPGKAATGEFALDTAIKALDLFADFFDFPFPLKKCDMVAISEFAAGAMENWSLITYREVDLLIDPVTASRQQKQRVGTVVCHELAHMWFGDLVTMAWWDDLWLNEGFASWAENYAADLIHPDYKYWDQFTVDHFTSALRLDALRSSHPIQVPIEHAEEVEQVFDAISYCKGASVVRMIKAVIGFSNFREGLRNYMKRYAYQNTETYDLWEAWEEVSKLPVSDLMKSWTEQMGFPLVRVTAEEWKEDAVTFDLEQMWFLADGSELDEEGKKKTWNIPIMTCTDKGTQQEMTLMREKTAKITVPTNSWVKLNGGQEVPMRVLPTEEMLKRLAVAMQNKTLPPIDRAGLIHDAYALVKAGHMKAETLIRLLDNCKEEDEYIVWNVISDALNGLDTVLSDDTVISENFRQFAKKLVVSLMQKVGWESQADDGHLTTLVRSIMIGLLGSFAHDDPSVYKEALARYQAFQVDASDVNTLPADMRSSVFKIILLNGGKKEYDDIKNYFSTAADNAERKHVMNSLGSIPDASLKRATMEWGLAEVKLQDFFYPMGSVGRSSKEGREIAWKFYQDNFDAYKAKIGQANPALMDACIVMCTGGGFASESKAAEIDQFFASHPLPQNTRKIAQILEATRANAKFLDMLRASELANPSFWDSLK